ncbi:MAG: DUF5320 domain-containing protein [Desulfobacterales bacterium]|nr:DUF5320 domain-containing protein [Desulfobacterales bacterium]
MPGFDRTGPMGSGPASGWGRGDCGAGAPMSTRTGVGYGRGFGRGYGPGYGRGGFRRGFGAGRFAVPARLEYADDLGMLKAEADMLKRSLDSINERMARIQAAAVPKENE